MKSVSEQLVEKDRKKIEENTEQLKRIKETYSKCKICNKHKELSDNDSKEFGKIIKKVEKAFGDVIKQIEKDGD